MTNEDTGLQQSARDLHELIEYLKLEKVVIGDMSPKVVNDAEWKLGLYHGWYTVEDVEKDAGYLAPKEAEARNLYFMEQVLLPHTPDEERRCIMPKEDPEGYAALKAAGSC